MHIKRPSARETERRFLNNIRRRGICFVQDDYTVANAAGATVRADINSNLQAAATLNSGASAPSTTFAGMLWYDTTNGVVKQRNAANSAWVVRWTVDTAGSVIQTVEGTSTTATTTTSSTYADTTLSVAITPKLSSSKVLVIVSQTYFVTRQSTDSRVGFIQLQRNGTAIATAGELGIAAGTDGVGTGVIGVCNLQKLDSPASASSVTYKTQAKVNPTTSSASLTTQYTSYNSSIVAMEIAA